MDDTIGPGVHTAVLVEGVSDQLALAALARRRGRRLGDEGVAIVAMGGATNARHTVRRYGPGGRGLRLAALCDVGEVGYFARALGAWAGADRAAAGLFVCDADLEEELIRSTGIDAMRSFIEAQGELPAFETLRKQPAQRGRTIEQQLHRFVGTRSGRKVRYAPALVDALDLDRIPLPLAALLDHL